MAESSYSKIVEKYSQFMDHTEQFEEILNAVEECIKISNKPIIEVGTNKGGSALCFLNVINEFNKNASLITVDPYSNIPYTDGGGTVEKSVYDDGRYRLAMKNITEYCYENELNHQHFKTTSEEFINIIYPNYKIYGSNSIGLLDSFSFIFLDGQHKKEIVNQEVDFFLPKLDMDCTMIVDDVNLQDYNEYIIKKYGIENYKTNIDLRNRLKIKRIR